MPFYFSIDEKDLLIIIKFKNPKPILGSYYKKRMRIKKSPARGTQNNCESASDK